MGIAEGGEGAPICIQQVLDSGLLALDEDLGIAGGKIVDLGIEWPGEAAFAQRGRAGGQRQVEGVAGKAVGGDDFDELASGEIRERHAEGAIGLRCEVEADDSGGFEKIAHRGKVGPAGVAVIVGMEWRQESEELARAVSIPGPAARPAVLFGTHVGPSVEEQAGAGQHGAGEDYGGSAFEDIAHFITQAFVS